MNFFPGESDQWLEKNLPLEVFGSSGKGLDDFCPLVSRAKECFQNNQTRIITIAGTNGKGETCLRLCHLIKKKLPDQNFALWTSPHLFSVRERFKYNGEMIEDQKLLELLKRNDKLASGLSYYEFLFYIFCQWTLELSLDFLVLEVGLGGRLDCVNCFDADYAAITSISRDHTEFLGERLEQILNEKLGVSRKNRPLISAVSQVGLRNELKSLESERGYILKDLYQEGVVTQEDSFSDSNQKLASELFTLLSGISIELKDWNDFRPGIGRGTVVQTKWGRILAMGSHNAEGLLALEKWLEWRGEKFFDGIFVGLSKRPTRDLLQCIKIINVTLKKRTDNFYLVGFEHPKAISKATLEDALSDEPELKAELFQHYCEFASWWELFEEKQSPKAQYLFTGSYYFIAVLLSALARAGILMESAGPRPN